MAQPTDLPKFAAVNNPADVEAPTAGAQDTGWSPALTRPNRRWMNWIHHWSYQWLLWLRDELEPRVAALEAAPGAPILTGQTQAAHIKTTDLSAQENFNILWSKYTNIVTLKFPSLFANGSGSSTQMRIYPDSVWSPHLLASTGTQKLWMPMAIIGGGKVQNGILKIPKVNTDPMDTFVIDDDGGAGPFPADASPRGFHECSVTYMSINSVT